MRTLTMLLVALVYAGCAAKNDDRKAGEEPDAAADGDTDADGDGDEDGGCHGVERYCADGDVVERDCADGGTAFIESCAPPRHCDDGECVFDGACQEAVLKGSNIGCEYWAVDVDNSEGTAIIQPYAVAVGNVGTAPVNVVVEARLEEGGYTVVAEQKIHAKDVGLFKLTGQGTSLTPELQSIAGSYHQPRMAYRLTADAPVIAYQFNPYSGLTEEDGMICANDATLLIPSSGIDRHYFVLAYPPNNGVPAYAALVATEDGTRVTITPTSDVMNGWDLPFMPAGVPTEIVMDAADVAQLESEGDLSGTYVEADKPLAVFAGNVTAFVPGTNVWFADHLEHQLIPLTKWGTEYIAARSRVRSNRAIPEKDFWRIIAAEDDTVVETVPEVDGFPVTLGAGEVVQVGRVKSFAIRADKPVMVGQFLAGADATGLADSSPRRGDPSFSLISPLEQFLTEYVFLAPDKYPFDYVVVTHPTGLEVDLDGELLTSYDDCEVEELDSDWTVTRCLIGDLTHTIMADEPVGITVWGYGENVSYGYVGGMNLESINPVL